MFAFQSPSQKRSGGNSSESDVSAMFPVPARIWNVTTAVVSARLNTRASFRPTRFVWSRGIALSCDHNGGLEFVRRQRGGGRPALRFVADAYANIREGDLVWVRVTALPQFVDEVLPHINARFALVTGDEDWSIPSGFEHSRAITSNSRVLCWFTQNYDGRDDSGKIHPIPIGIDFHTISERHKWGHWQATPQQQELELDALRAAMPANGDRLVRAHADFHFNKRDNAFNGDTRHTIQAILAANPSIDFQQRKVPRLDLWREKTRYAFVISPHGHGLDCHRTWESLALGNIVIVKRSSLDSLYEGLPVVIVEDWRDITTQSLHRWHSEHRDAFARGDVQERLTNRYWLSRMRRMVAERMVESTLPHE
jgi:hypothetical protein